MIGLLMVLVGLTNLWGNMIVLPLLFAWLSDPVLSIFNLEKL